MIVAMSLRRGHARVQSTVLDVCLFGAPQVAWRKRPLAIRRRAVRALLFYLAAQRAPVPRDVLLLLLWGDQPETVARRRLTFTLAQLRAALVAGGAPDDLLQATSDGIALNLARCRVDLHVFEEAAHEARAAGWPTGALAAGERALAACEGEFLAGLALPDAPDFEEWLAAERERLATLRHDTLVAVARRHAHQGEFARAQALLADVLHADPLREDAHAELMECLAALGDRAAARRQYAQLRVLLARELDVEPLPETEARYRRMLDETPAPVALPPAPALGEAPFTGRAAELCALAQAWAHARAGRGQAVLLAGPPGQGKTRLAAEFARRAGAEAGRLEAAGYPSTAALPYQLFDELLRPALETLAHARGRAEPWREELLRLLPGRGPGATAARDAGDGRARLWEAIARGLRSLAACHPLLLVLNDLQWADAASLPLLAYLTRRLADAPVLWIGTLRAGEAGAAGELAAELRRAPNATVIDLAPLGADDVAALLGDGSLAAQLYAESEGNPFFLVEIIRELCSTGVLHATAGGWRFVPGTELNRLPMPENVRVALRARLATLSPLARQALGAAAVAGRTCAPDLLRRVAGHTEDALLPALDELVAAGWLRVQDGAYGFAHGKFQEAALDDLGPARRLALHRRAARALLRLPRRVQPHAEIARHAAQAGLWPAAVEHARAAAAEAVRRYAYAGALAFETEALAALEHLDDNVALELDVRLSREQAFALLGRREEQRAELDRLRQLANREPDGAQPACLEVAFREARYLYTAGELQQAEHGLQALLAEERAGADLAREARLLLAQCLVRQGRAVEAGAVAQAMLDAAERAGDATARLACVLTLAEVAQVAEDLDSVCGWIARAETTGVSDRLLELRLLRLQAWVALQTRRYEEATTLARQGQALAHGLGSLEGEAQCLQVAAATAGRVERSAESLRLYGEANERYQALGQRLNQARTATNMGLTCIRAGDFEAAATHTRAALALFDALGDRMSACGAHGQLGACLARMGLGAEAEVELRAALALAEALNLAGRRRIALENLGIALMLQDRAHEAAAAFREYLALAQDQPSRERIITHIWLALACVRTGDLAEADQLSSLAVEDLSNSRPMFHPQLVHFVRAQVLRALGDLPGAHAALAAAVEGLEHDLAIQPSAAARKRYLHSMRYNLLIRRAAQHDCWPEKATLI
jgi:DNA-binding SARP family transcriptional activator/Flp pilus assembly protein TadD/DNA polymerase III delta prime subunit